MADEQPAPKKAKVSPEPKPDKTHKHGDEEPSVDDFVGSDYLGSDYTGLVISCIRVQSIGDSTVEFTETDSRGDRAVFLTNLREIKGRRSVRRYRATLLGAEEAMNFIRNPPKPESVEMSDEDWKRAFRNAIPLFCVHGFDVDPSDLFDSMEKRHRYANKPRCVQEIFAAKGGRYYPVPVLWPCSIFGLVTYQLEQETNSLEARNTFRTLADAMPDSAFPRKSLMMHGMGNHLVLNGGCTGESAPEIRFDDIFLVAADVDFDVFHKQPCDVDDQEKPRRAKHLFSMLRTEETGDGSVGSEVSTDSSSNSNNSGKRPVGKIHILHNVNDVALLLSKHEPLLTAAATGKTNIFVNKLGQRGAGMYTVGEGNPSDWRDDKQREILLEELWKHLVNTDCSNKSLYSNKLNHDYQFDDFCIAYYSDPEANRTAKEQAGSYTMD